MPVSRGLRIHLVGRLLGVEIAHLPVVRAPGIRAVGLRARIDVLLRPTATRMPLREGHIVMTTARAITAALTLADHHHGKLRLAIGIETNAVIVAIVATLTGMIPTIRPMSRVRIHPVRVLLMGVAEHGHLVRAMELALIQIRRLRMKDLSLQRILRYATRGLRIEYLPNFSLQALCSQHILNMPGQTSGIVLIGMNLA